MRSDLIKYLQYVKNTGGNATIVDFDDDWEPIGPMVRKELMPEFFMEGPNEKLILTQAGMDALK